MKTSVFENNLTATVVVAARNEAENIVRCLESLKNQTLDSGRYEVIVVDDFSTDDTAAVVQHFIDENGLSNFRCIQPAREFSASGKKNAISAAIAVASGQIILTTDADCVCPPQWIEKITSAFDAQTALVSGGVRLAYAENSLFQKFQALESAGLVSLGAAGLSLGLPGLCNGANLAYRKSVFIEVNGFEGVNNLASGDDMLLLQKIARLKKYRLRFLKDSDAITETRACHTFGNFWRQRLRWVSKNKGSSVPLLWLSMAFSYLGSLSVAVFIVGACFDGRLGWALALVFGLKSLSDWTILRLAAQFIRRPTLMRIFPLAEIMQTIYMIVIGFAGSLGLKYEWKGRRVR